MGKTLYLECNYGIAGDMLVAALIDLGASQDKLIEVLDSLGLEGYELKISQVEKSGLAMCDFDVALDDEHANHDHDMKWLYGSIDEAGTGAEAGAYHEHEYGHGHHCHEHHDCGHEHHDCGHEHHGHGHHCHEHHDCGHEHHGHGHHCHGHKHHCHEHEHHGHGHHCHEHEHEHSDHVHRHLDDVLAIIDASKASMRAKKIAAKTFTILAQAEAKAHGTTPERVHFHEVGALDSIIDILACAVCLDELDITDVIVEKLVEGHGSIRCQHGIVPVPVPAVAQLIAEHSLALERLGVHAELTTPTGAALVCAIKTSDTLPSRYQITALGMGAGKRNYHFPNYLRAMLIEPLTKQPHSPAQTDTAATGESLYKLECDLDDCTGEALGRIIEQLMQKGAREAHFIPLVMKKGRPGWQLQVICDKDLVSTLEALIFADTTTIGIRRQPFERTTLARSIETIPTEFGPMSAKRVEFPWGASRLYPEHDEVARLAREMSLPFIDVWQVAESACRTSSQEA